MSVITLLFKCLLEPVFWFLINMNLVHETRLVQNLMWFWKVTWDAWRILMYPWFLLNFYRIFLPHWMRQKQVVLLSVNPCLSHLISRQIWTRNVLFTNPLLNLAALCILLSWTWEKWIICTSFQYQLSWGYSKKH